MTYPTSSSASSSSDSENEYHRAPPRLPNPQLSPARRPTPPSSPTLTSRSFIAAGEGAEPLSPASHNVNRSTRRHGVQMHNFYTPLSSADEIRAVGEGYAFCYEPRVRGGDLSPRSTRTAGSGPFVPRSLSGGSEEGSDEEDDDDDENDEDDDESEYVRIPTIESPTKPPTNQVLVDFTLIEMSEHSSTSSSEADSETSSETEETALSILLPSRYSSASSRRSSSSTHSTPSCHSQHSATHTLAADFSNLDCSATLASRDAWIKTQRALKRTKRLSSGSIHKRTLSMSIGSDTDDEDLGPYECEIPGLSASGLRRIRRKTGEMHEEGLRLGLGLGMRGSLIFEDPPQRIVECEEPTSEEGERWRAERRVESGREEMMNVLPYYLMDMDERAF